jgi:hypothetical protein
VEGGGERQGGGAGQRQRAGERNNRQVHLVSW